MIVTAKVISKEGKTQTLTREAESTIQMEQTLLKEGYHILSIKESKKISLINILKKEKKINKVLFFRELDQLLISGITLQKALEIIASYSDNSIYKRMLEQLKKGTPFSEITKKETIFSSSDVAMIKSGEDMGEFNSIISLLALHLKKVDENKKKMMALLYYPAFLLVFMGIVFSYVLFKVLPVIFENYSDIGINLSPIADKIIFIIQEVNKNAATIFPSFVATISLLLYLLIKNKEKVLTKLTILPFFGDIIKNYFLFLLLRPLTLMLKKGMYIQDVLNSLSTSFEKYQPIKKLLKSAKDEIKKGKGLATSFTNSSLFTKKQKELIKISEDSSNFIETLEYISETNEQDFENSLKKLISIIEPTLIIVVGSIVLVFVILFIVPLMDVNI